MWEQSETNGVVWPHRGADIWFSPLRSAVMIRSLFLRKLLLCSCLWEMNVLQPWSLPRKHWQLASHTAPEVSVGLFQCASLSEGEKNIYLCFSKFHMFFVKTECQGELMFRGLVRAKRKRGCLGFEINKCDEKLQWEMLTSAEVSIFKLKMDQMSRNMCCSQWVKYFHSSQHLNGAKSVNIGVTILFFGAGL